MMALFDDDEDEEIKQKTEGGRIELRTESTLF